MLVSEIFDDVATLVNDSATSGTPASSNIYWTSPEAFSALNEAQEVFSLLTLCLEATGSIPLTAARCFYGARGYLSGYLLPLRVSVAGRRLEAARITDLDARYNTWSDTPGTPEKYSQPGLNLLAIVPQPTSTASASIVYAREPIIITSIGQTPEIPTEYHPALVKYVAYYLLQKRGGQYLALALGYWEEFLAAVARCADYVRRRNRARQYDHTPAEIRMPAKKEGALING